MNITATQATTATPAKARKTPSKSTKNRIIYQGPSLIDAAPIVVIAIVQSGNKKTGNLIQTHIIRSDISPLEASKTGKDYSICGDCKLRGKPTDDPLKKQAVDRECYVNLGQGPSQVFKALKAGKYPAATPEETRKIAKGRMVRLGTYGDPAAAPQSVWNDLLHSADGHTAYTHQHGMKSAKANYNFMMLSADTQQEAQEAHAKGYRTFRVIPLKEWTDNGRASMLKTEINCPASKEAGAKVQCKECRLCNGSESKAKSIVIVDHGPQRKREYRKKALKVTA